MKILEHRHIGNRDLFIECKLEAEKYFMYIEVTWEQSANKRVTISAGSAEEKVILEQGIIKCHRNFLDKLFLISAGCSEVVDTVIYNPKMHKRLEKLAGYMFLRYTNNDSTTTLNEEMVYDATNLQICRPYVDSSSSKTTGQKRFAIKVGPSSVKIVKFWMQPYWRGSVSLNS